MSMEQPSAGYVPAPDEQEEAQRVPAGRWRALSFVGAGLLIAAVVALVTMSPYPAQVGGNQVEREVQDVLQLFPVPSTVRVANDMLSRLPRHDSSDAVVAHLQRHAEALFADFLVVFGSTAPRVGAALAPGTPTARRSFDDVKEHSHRFNVFRNSLAEVVKLNARSAAGKLAASRATFGITKISDWTHTEFKSLLGLKGHGPSGNNLMGFTGTKKEFVARMERKRRYDVPAVLQPSCERNWATELPEIFIPRNQGPCGSCWAHSVAQEMRAVYAVENGGQDPGELSVEYLVDCQPDVQGQTCGEGVDGCCGGWPSASMDWVISSGGIPTKADYGPYVSSEHPEVDHPCIGGVPKRVTMSSYLKINFDEHDMSDRVCNDGPLGVAVWANAAWQYYTGGVLMPPDCNDGLINHAVQVVGVQEGNSGSFWVVRNSWGPEWGVTPYPPFEQSSDAGFILLAYGLDTCQIGFEAVIPQGVTDATGETDGATGTTTSEPAVDPNVCTNTCSFSGDGDCDDGGDGSSYTFCEYGTDCIDCGERGNEQGCLNTCRWHNDGECDEPGLCDPGTDCSDCGPSAADCTDSCRYAGDGDCDDGGSGSSYSLCEFGTDCSDCGTRGENGDCSNTCNYSGDGDCDDGGSGSSYSLCEYGTDCDDCGSRQ